ncbi:acyltransferase family protein [Lacticaseibacillus absianus]|uniref:acyltransferase family protein n=1 Tax=Lacticaseibacillus absianus TaxID=2729623 RepID=UPI0015CEF30F
MDLLLWGLLILILLSVRPTQNLVQGHLDKSSTDGLKGVSILVIMLHHLSQATLHTSSTNLWFSKLTITGRFAVAIFFFVSGYGLVRQFQLRGPAYLQRFFPHRILPILKTYFWAMLIVFLIKRVTLGLSLTQAGLSLVTGSPFVDNSWFIVAILYFYVAFWLTYSIPVFTSTMKSLVLGGLTIVYIAGTFHLGFGEWWYNAAATFWLGTLLAEHEQSVFDRLNRHYWLILTASLVIFGLCFKMDYSHHTDLIRALSVVAFIGMVVVITTKFQLKNPLFTQFSRLSIYLYLAHGIFIRYLRYAPFIYVRSSVAFSLLVLICSFGTALFFTAIPKYLRAHAINRQARQ